MFYDPMIAKLITWGSDRAEAIARMRSALDRFIISGVSHNLSFLSALMAHPRYVAGNISTHMIGEEYPDGFHPADLPHEDPVIILAVAAAMVRRYRDRAARIDGQLRGHERTVPAEWVVVMNGEHYPLSVIPAEGGHDVVYDGKTYAVRSDWEFGQHLFSGTLNGKEVHVQVQRRDQVYRLSRAGSQSDLRIMGPRAAELLHYMPEKAPPDTSKHLLSPMPGLLVSLAVTEGQEVKAGEELAVLEAMKMENTLRAERNGLVAKIHFEPGASLEVGDRIMDFE
jgi:propionyl-CoA carboxylase alpha chain